MPVLGYCVNAPAEIYLISVDLIPGLYRGAKSVSGTAGDGLFCCQRLTSSIV